MSWSCRLPRPHPLLAWAAIAIQLLMVPPVVYLLAYNRVSASPPVTIDQSRTVVIGVRDRTIDLGIYGQRHRDCALNATTQYREDGSDVIHALANPHRLIFPAEGPAGRGVLRLPLPSDLKPGLYWVQSVGEYRCPDGGTFQVATGWRRVRLT